MMSNLRLERARKRTILSSRRFLLPLVINKDSNLSGADTETSDSARQSQMIEDVKASFLNIDS
jgi:hypothetical protein